MAIKILDDGLPEYGQLRPQQIHLPDGPTPISKSQFWHLVKERNIPCVKISPRVTVFSCKNLRIGLLGNPAE